MSRIGKQSIAIPSGVTITVDNHNVTVSGPLGTLNRVISPKLETKIENNEFFLINNDKDPKTSALHGLYRQLINNMVVGVSKGYEKRLNINGVGYKVAQNGNDLVLNCGFSHPVDIKAVDGIKLSCEKTIIIVKGFDKELVGQFAAKVRDIKRVEPYHAYGISYENEVIRRKEVKSGKK